MELEAKIVDQVANNAAILEIEFEWLSNIINARVQHEFGKDSNGFDINSLLERAIDEQHSSSLYYQFVQQYKLSSVQRIMLLLSIAPVFKPEALDVFLVQNKDIGQMFTEFGGKQGKQRAFIPSSQTLLFILAGKNLTLRFQYQSLLHLENPLLQKGFLTIESLDDSSINNNGLLLPTQDIIDLLSTGVPSTPIFNSNFPAKKIETEMNWDDLVLSPNTKSGIDEIIRWINYSDQILDEWEMSRILKKGHRSLFFGPPGTGKTLTASLLGKHFNKEVYKVDIAKLVSKYIGETEKNLANILDRAEHKDWILFFDEADALFGKRTQVDSSNDKYANQEVAYLLQRIEDYNGLVILASNLKQNIDSAFIRRFQSVVYFPTPKASERKRLWQKVWPKQLKQDQSVDLNKIAHDHELTGGTITNVISYVSLNALHLNKKTVSERDIIEGIQKELIKGGKTL